MDKAIKTFEKYLEQFNRDNPNINFKIKHTYRVVALAKEMAKRLNLNEEDKELIMLIGLLHDIGRFYQLKLNDSFSDFLFDHATYGVKYLFDEGHIKDFVSNDNNNEIIKNAIYYHNRYTTEIPKFDERTKMFADLIRDIDKIDIYYVVYLKNNTIFSKDEISSSYLDDFFNKKLVRKIPEEKKSDNLVGLCGFIYDFNYVESLELLKEKGYLDLLFSSVKVLDNKDLFLEIKQNVYNEMNRRLKK